MSRERDEKAPSEGPILAASSSDDERSTTFPGDEDDAEVFLNAIDVESYTEELQKETCVTSSLSDDSQEEGNGLEQAASHENLSADIDNHQLLKADSPVVPFLDWVPKRKRSISNSPMRNIETIRSNIPGPSSILTKRPSRSKILPLTTNSVTKSASKFSTKTSASKPSSMLSATTHQIRTPSPTQRAKPGNRQKCVSESSSYLAPDDVEDLSELFPDLEVSHSEKKRCGSLDSAETNRKKYIPSPHPIHNFTKTRTNSTDSSLHNRTVTNIHRSKIIDQSKLSGNRKSGSSTSTTTSTANKPSSRSMSSFPDYNEKRRGSAPALSKDKSPKIKSVNRRESSCHDYHQMRRGSAPDSYNVVKAQKCKEVNRSNSIGHSNLEFQQGSDPSSLIARAYILEAADNASRSSVKGPHPNRRLSLNPMEKNPLLNRFRYASEHCMSPTEVHFSLLPEDDKNRFVNKKAVDIAMPKAFSAVLGWCCDDKEENESFIDYFSRHNYNRSKIKKIFHFEDSTLSKLEEAHNSELFDASVLYSLIVIGCEIHVKKFPQTDMKALQQALKEAKQLRNGVVHEPKGAASAPSTYAQVRRSLMKLIKIAGRIFSVTLIRINIERMRITQEMELIMRITSKEERLIRTQWKFRTEAWQESKRYWDEFQSQYIPFSDEKVSIRDIYHPLYLRLKKDSTLNTNKENLVAFDNVLEPPPKGAKLQKVTAVEGEVGTGKSTSIINFGLQFYGQIPLTIETLNSYDLLYIFECRNQTHKSFEDYILRSFPKTCKSLEIKEVIQSMSYMNNLIFIDGYDEINKNSQRVVLDIVNIIKTWSHTRVVFTMRPFASSKFSLMMRNEGLSYEICSLANIMSTASQIHFLERYVKARNTGHSHLVKTFTSLPKSLKVFFQTPINLVLFYHLHWRSPQAVQYWFDESDVLKEIYDLFQIMIKNKMNSLYIDNFSVILDDIMDETCLLAFECLLTDKMVLDEKDFVAFTKRCIMRGVRKLPYDQVLSNIFITKNSHSPYSETYYQFYHKSVQEYLASESLLKLLRHNEMSTKNVIRMVEFENRRRLHAQDEEGRPAASDSNEDYSKLENMLILALIQLTRDDKPDGERIKEVVQLLPAPEDNDHPYDILYARLDRDFETRNFYYWNRLMERCRYHPAVIASVAELVSWDTVIWDSEDHPTTATSTQKAPWLLFGAKFSKASGYPAQPTKVFVRPPASQECPTDLGPVLHMLLVDLKFTGKLFLSLKHSHSSFTPCDDVLSHLHGSQCSLKQFQGCLSWPDSLAALGSALAPDVRLDISMTKPQPLNLEKLQGTDHCIRVTLQCGGKVDQPMDGAKCALPRSTYRPPELRVVEIPANAWERVRDIVTSLVPLDKSLYAIELPGCELSDEELELLTEALTIEKVNTERGSWCYVDSTWRSEPTPDGHTRDVELFLRRRCP